jgi:hypothetical protein
MVHLSSRAGLVSAVLAMAGCGAADALPRPHMPLACESPTAVIVTPFACAGWTHAPLTLSMLVRADGQVQEVWIDPSSAVQGQAIESCAKKALSRAMFLPARGCDGQPVAGTVTQTWSLIHDDGF